MQGPTARQNYKLTAYENILDWVSFLAGLGTIWFLAWVLNPNIDSGMVWILAFIYGSLTARIIVTRTILLRLL